LCVFAALGNTELDLAHSAVLLIGIDVGHSKKEFGGKVETRRESIVGLVAILIVKGNWYTYWGYGLMGAGTEVIGVTKRGVSIRTTGPEKIREERAMEDETGENTIKSFVKEARAEFRDKAPKIDYVFVFFEMGCQRINSCNAVPMRWNK